MRGRKKNWRLNGERAVAGRKGQGGDSKKRLEKQSGPPVFSLADSGGHHHDQSTHWVCRFKQHYGPLASLRAVPPAPSSPRASKPAVTPPHI
eukprot:239070-Pyramimonas_sp.AAC.2